MLKLREYFNKTVELIDIDNVKWTGVVETYTPAIDSDEEIEEIGLLTTNGLVCFNADEIKTINLSN